MDLLTNTFRQFSYTSGGSISSEITVQGNYGTISKLNARIVGIQAPENTKIYFNAVEPSKDKEITIGYTHIYQLELSAADEMARIHSIMFSLPAPTETVIVDVLDSGKTEAKEGV